MVDMYPKDSNAVKYDSMNISLEGSSFRNLWQGEISKKFATMLDVFDMLWPFDDLSRIIAPFLAILFASCVSDIEHIYIVILQKNATNDIMSLTYQFITPLERKFTDTKVVVFTEG
jgi:hypothetical protein